MRRLVAALGAAALAATLSGCWLQPGFDAGRTNWNRSETTITAADVDDLALVWDVEVAGEPVGAYGDLVLVQADLTITALDAATGATRWTVDLREQGLPADARVVGRPAIAGGTLHVPWGWFTRGGLARVDAATGAPVDLDVSSATPLGDPAVVDDRLVAGASQVMGTSFVTVTTIGGPGFVPTFYQTGGAGPGPGGAFAVVGGRIAWSWGTEATGFGPACRAYEPPGPGLPVPPGCAPDWRTDLGARPVDVAGLGPAHVAYVDESGTLTVLATATGAVAWTAEVGAPGDLTVAGGEVVVGTADGVVAFPHALGCGNPTCPPTWTVPDGAGATIAGRDVVYVSVGADVRAFPVDRCRTTCAPLATLSVPGTSVRASIVDGRQVFGATGDGRVVAFGLP